MLYKSDFYSQLKSYKNHYFGIYAEKFVMIILWLKGYKILKNRYRNNYGEIDVIAVKKNFIIFCEIKFSSQKINVEKVLSSRQILRIKNCAQEYIARNSRLHSYRRRYDFIEVTPLILFILKIRHRINFIS